MARRVDAHCHLWRLGRGDYGWLLDGPPALDPIRRDFDLDDLRAAMPGIEVAVLVQAAPSVAETEFLLGCARAGAPRVGGVVGWVDLADPASVADVERLARDPLFKGVRPMLQDVPDPDWIATRPAPACIGALERLGLRFDALVTPRELPALLRFVGAHPGLPVMVDHAANPALVAEAGDPRRAAWRDGMRALAGAKAFCKLSGLLTELPPRAPAHAGRGRRGTAARARRPRRLVRPRAPRLGIGLAGAEPRRPARLLAGGDEPPPRRPRGPGPRRRAREHGRPFPRARGGSPGRPAHPAAGGPHMTTLDAHRSRA